MAGPDGLRGAGPKSVLNGRYRVGPSAGPWAYGEAALAADEWTYKTVVLKIISAEDCGGPAGLPGLRSWAERLKEVRHAALPVVEDVFEDEGRLVLVVERLKGQPLSSFLGQGIQVELPSALVHLCQVAAGLDHAHAQMLVHGNLNPGGILVTENGRSKLVDFGLGQALRAASGSSGTVPEGVLYMAPEQEAGAALPGSDLYALGMILFQMTTGRLPFEPSCDWAAKREMRPLPSASLAPQLPLGFDGVVGRVLDPDPSARYALCAELIAALEALT